MTLREQDEVVVVAVSRARTRGWETKTVDYRERGGHSGYRAVHVIMHLQRLGRVEVQIRTHLQGRWANVYEALADVVGREIRYDTLPTNPLIREEVERLQAHSLTEIAMHEDLRTRAEDSRHQHLADDRSDELEQRIQDIRALDQQVTVSMLEYENLLRQMAKRYP